MELTIRPMTPQERMYAYSQSSQIESQTGCIGHLRADMGSNGEGFFSSWTDHRGDLKTQDFKDEFDEVINALRFESEYGDILKNLHSLSKYCHSHPESSYGNDREYGFRADTPSYTFMLRLNPNKGDYNLYCYCFKRDWLDRHLAHAAKGIRFITPDYKEMFRVEDGDSIRITKDNGLTADYVCRYIDEYHVEVGGAHGNLYHICEFAERMKMAGSTVIPIRASLPERCFSVLQATGEVVALQRGKKFCARIATGDYDAVIIGHSQFEKIPMSAERQQIIINRQIEEIMDGIDEAKHAKAERYTIKQLERTKHSLETRLAKLNDQSRKDSLVTFEELGVDRIFIDESHYFKNLFLATKMRNVGGIAQTEAQKSSDLFMKTQYLDEITGGRGVIFATGTPISNSMVELYTIQRYLQYHTLEEMDMLHFDDWAAAFGETITAVELSPEGSGYRAKTRFAKFYNLPELMSTFKMAADIQTADMLKLPVPKADFHTEVIKPSEIQQEMVAGLAERAEKIRAGGVDPKVDNMLRITNDGRKLALDMRLINPLAADDENGKVSTCARNVFRIWEQTTEQRGAQLVFCDLSTPKDDGSFNVYDDLKKKLMAMGIPENEIAYIHDANTEARKKELFAKVRAGQVRILLGSTQKMGAGTNVQDRLVALHDLDCPWRPSDLAQRLGRIIRQGNQNAEVDIYRYVTENTFDAYLYQLVENKQKFIAQIMTSKSPVRVADDIDETALSYSEIKALATGNPLIIEKCNLDMEVAKLNVLKASHLSQKYALEEMVLRKYPQMIQDLKQHIFCYEQDTKLVELHPKPAEGFVGLTLMGKEIADKEAAGKAIIDVCTTMTGSGTAEIIGEYRGFFISIAYEGAKNEYQMHLKGAMTHTVVLGADVYGNITRMDNVIDGIAGKLKTASAELTETQVQMENAREEMNAPFAKEDELKEKEARLKELNILLNMDQKDRSLIDDTPEEDTPDRPRPRGIER